MKTGLLSVTFRNLMVEKIIEETVNAKLDAIEWGGDIHVPHGDLDRARYVKKLCIEANIETPSYGSYFRAATSMEFLPVIETAKELGAKTIRIWAGTKNSELYSQKDLIELANEVKKICQKAKENKINVALEFHSGTVTNTNESALSFIEMVNESNLYSYWQTPLDKGFEYRKNGIIMLGNKLSSIHVFNWKLVNDDIIKLPLYDKRLN